jgi:SAM-dependent methyltransferase
VIWLYQRHAEAWDSARSRELRVEGPWLERLFSLVPGGAALDLGCGGGDPIARALAERGFAVTGVDASPGLLGLCRARLPDHRFLEGDLRDPALAPGGPFDLLLAWDSLFHLSADAQRGVLGRLAAWTARGAALLFNTGPTEGVALGVLEGEPLHHASLGPAEYGALLAAGGFEVLEHRSDDPASGGRTVWLARMKT